MCNLSWRVNVLPRRLWIEGIQGTASDVRCPRRVGPRAAGALETAHTRTRMESSYVGECRAHTQTWLRNLA